MRWIFEDPGNRRALGLDKSIKTYEIHIREPGTITIRDEELFFKIKSALIQNKINHEYEVKTIINN